MLIIRYCLCLSADVLGTSQGAAVTLDQVLLADTNVPALLRSTLGGLSHVRTIVQYFAPGLVSYPSSLQTETRIKAVPRQSLTKR